MMVLLVAFGMTSLSQLAHAQSDGWLSATDTYDYRTISFEYPERFSYVASTANVSDRLTYFEQRSITLSEGEKKISISYSEEGDYILKNVTSEAADSAVQIKYGENEGTLLLNPFPPVSSVIRIFTFEKAEYVFNITDIGSGLSQAEWDSLLSSIHVEVAEIAPVPPPDRALGAYRHLCKTQSGITVYNCSLIQGGMRFPFIDESTFRAWGFDFKDVQVVSDETMAEQPLGSPVLPPRGTWIKIQSKPETYEVQRDGKTLRWIADEETALVMRGAEWNKNIYTVDVTLWNKFEIGDPIRVKVEAL